MFAGEVISQAVTRHFGGPVESGICFGIPRHHLKRNGRIVCYNDKVAKNIFWTGAGGPRLIRNFGEVALT